MEDESRKIEPEQAAKPQLNAARRRREYGKIEVPEHYREDSSVPATANPGIKPNDLLVTLTVVVKDCNGTIYDNTLPIEMVEAKLPDEAEAALRFCKHDVTGWWKKLERKLILTLIRKQDAKKPTLEIKDAKTDPNDALIPTLSESELAEFDSGAPSLDDIPDEAKTNPEITQEGPDEE